MSTNDSEEEHNYYRKLAPIKGGRSFQAELARALSLVLDIEGKNQMYHAWRVGVLSTKLASLLDPSLTVPLTYAGLLHDIGKVGIDDHVAYHPDQENQKYIPWLRSHSLRGAEIMGEIPGMWDTVPHVLNHHERWDGKGYPRGLYGNSLTLGAQIIRVADSSELLLRQYKQADSDDYIADISRLAGTQVSREVGEAAGRLLSSRDFFNHWSDTETLPALVDAMLT
ncbi:MAG: HD domain-containing phosphohydrolase, partial [Actinomycetota bacterium]